MNHHTIHRTAMSHPKDITLDVILNNVSNPVFDGSSVIIGYPLDVRSEDLFGTGRKVPVLHTPLEVIPLRAMEYALHHKPDAKMFSTGTYAVDLTGRQLLVPVQFYRSVDYRSGKSWDDVE